MKPIDIIRRGIDNDLIKNNNITMCVIPSEQDIKDIDGVGIVINVIPITESDPYGKGINESKLTSGEYTKYPVLIANRTPGWQEKDRPAKYFVMAINSVHNSLNFSVGFLVPKTMTDLSGDIESVVASTNENLKGKY